MTASYKPPHIPAFVPYFVVRDAQAAIDFYQKAFGFQLETACPGEDGSIKHVEMRFQESVFMFAPEAAFECFAPEGGNSNPKKSPKTLNVDPSCVFYVYCTDVDEFFKRAVQEGAKSLIEPNDTFWGDRMCSVVDQDGYEWSFATYKGQ